MDSTAALRTLRKRTGVGVVDAARALKDASSDLAGAAELLRERGLCDKPVVRYPRMARLIHQTGETGLAGPGARGGVASDQRGDHQCPGSQSSTGPSWTSKSSQAMHSSGCERAYVVRSTTNCSNPAR